jgi:excisionase family DNA binding protein
MKRNARIDEAMLELNCSRRTIYRLLADGELVAFKIRGTLRITLESIAEYQRRQISKYALRNG